MKERINFKILNKLVEVEDKRVVLSCGNSYVVKYFTGYPQVLKQEELNS